MAYSILRRHMQPIEEEMRFFQHNDILRRHMRPFETDPSLFPDINAAEQMTQSFYDQLHSAREQQNGFYAASNGFAFYRDNAVSSRNQASDNTQNTNQQRGDPCKCGLAGNTLNNDMYADEILRAVFDTLQTKIHGDNEWTLSISKSGNKYKPSYLKECNPNDGTIPPYPDGEKVANAHIHPRGNQGVPSGGDVYSFLKSVRDTKTIKTMFVLGAGWELFGKNTLEVYAINAYDIEAINAFLKKYPEEKNKNFLQEFSGEVGEIFDKAYNRYNKGERNLRFATTLDNYHYFHPAVALAYTMWYFNMGITLSRKVDNGPFMVISVIDIMRDGQMILDIGVCEE